MAGLLARFSFSFKWSDAQGQLTIGDALSHSQSRVAGAYMFGPPLALGASLQARYALAMLFLTERQGLRHHRHHLYLILRAGAVHGFGQSGFLSADTIIMGNILAISPEDKTQLLIISLVSLGIMAAKWKDMMLVFFDESHARSVGLRPEWLKLVPLPSGLQLPLRR